MGPASDTSMPRREGLQRSWVQCADGQIAIGGGFGKNTQSSPDLVITGSFPAGIDGDGTIVTETSAYEDSEFNSGDEDWSMVGQNGWVVEGYYTPTDDSEIMVRPYVICATLAGTATP